MSFLAKSPQMTASTAQDATQFSTYREGEAVPVGYGTDYFPSQWMCAPYNWRTQRAGNSKPDWQYCSIAAEYRDGPIDFVGRLKRDGKVISTFNYTFGVGEESHEFVINPSLALGQAWKVIVHRGTETAGVSASLIAGTGQNHPPMRGRAWAEWINIDLGGGITALPDLQLELGKGVPAIGAFAGGSSTYGVNPFAAIYAILRDVAAFDLDAAYLDAAHWGAQCVALETTGIADRTGSLVHCHPIFKSAQDAAALLSTILSHVDGYLYVDDGKFKVGWFPSQAPGGGLTEITEADLEAAPANGSVPDWNKGAQSVVVIFRDKDREYNDAPALCPAPANKETGVISTPKRNERPMIHEAGQAAMIAAEISAASASAESTITLTVKKSRAVTPGGAPLMPGDLMAWDYGPHSLDLIVRVVGRRMRSGNTSDMLEVIPERGQFPLPYVAPVDARVLPTNAAPGEIVVGDVRLWVLPSGFGALRQLAPLVNRAHRGIYRVDLHLSPTGAAPWENILDSRFFAAKVAVTNGGVGSGAATVRVISTSVDFARMAAQSTVAQTDDTLLLLVGSELMSVGTITVVAANTYDLGILRARKSTTAAAHADTAVGFLFYRSELTAAQHAEFYRVRDGSNIYNAGIATKYFKFQLYTIDEDGLAKPDDPGVSLTLPDLSPDESAGYTILLTSEAHTVACDSAGTVNAGQLGGASTAKTDVKVFRGGTPLTAVNAGPNSDQFSISISAATNATGTKEDNDTVRGDTLSADTGTISIDVNVAGAFTVTKTFTLTKAKAGATGGTGPTGGTGATGSTGNTVERRYTRSTLVPATPTGTSPAGWTTAIPSGTDALWVSEATKDSTGALVGSWSTPQRLTGNVIFYQNSAPAPGGYTLIDGDLWFDLDDGNRPYRWEDPGGGYAWVAKPFGDAAIANLAAGKITAGTIQAAISIGTLGSLTAGSGYGQFYVDTTQMKHGAMTVNQYPSFSGTQQNIVSGNHQMTAYAYDLGAAVFVQNNGTGKNAAMFDSGLIRGNSMEAGTDGFTSQGASVFNGTCAFNGIGSLNAKLKLTGSNRFEFSADGSGNTYFDEGWGARAHGDGQHPFQVRGAALCLDGCSGGGTVYSAGRLYLTDTIYLYVVAGALWLKDGNGDRALT